MAVDSYGDRGQPQFSALGGMEAGADETTLADYSSVVGTRRVGTTAQRDALSGAKLFVGLAWGDSVTHIEYVYTSDGWAAIARADSTGTVTLGAGITAVSKEIVRSGNAIYLNIRDAQRTAAWGPGAIVATISGSMAPTAPVVANGLESATGVAKGALVNSAGQAVIFETVNSGTAGRVSITATWLVPA